MLCPTNVDPTTWKHDGIARYISNTYFCDVFFKGAAEIGLNVCNNNVFVKSYICTSHVVMPHSRHVSFLFIITI